MFPDLISSDPYSDLLDAALRDRGIEVERHRDLDPRWVKNRVGEVDTVHLHWVEFLFWPGGRSRLYRLASMWTQAMRLIRALALLRASKVQILWTVHHPIPRESPYPRVHRLVQRAIVRFADALVVHSEHATARARQMASDTPVYVVPHGGYRGVYPPAHESRAQTRRRLGLEPHAFVYLIFGTVRDYKRVPDAIRAFRSFQDPGAQLLVAGAAAGTPRRETEEAARGDGRVRLELRSIPDGEVAALFCAADALILNYAEVFSSGALLLSLAFGLPVIAPWQGSAVELAPPPATVPFGEGELGRALAEAQSDPTGRRQAAVAVGETASWERSAGLLESIYRGSLEVKPAGGSVFVENGAPGHVRAVVSE